MALKAWEPAARIVNRQMYRMEENDGAMISVSDIADTRLRMLWDVLDGMKRGNSCVVDLVRIGIFARLK